MLHGSGSTERTDLRLVTAADGEVQFELPKPAPSHFAVRVKLSDKDSAPTAFSLTSSLTACGDLSNTTQL